MQPEHRVAGHLGVRADDFDRSIRTFIPGYERMLAAIVQWLDGNVPSGGLVVDLGAELAASRPRSWTRSPTCASSWSTSTRACSRSPRRAVPSMTAATSCAERASRIRSPAAMQSSRRCPCTTSRRSRRSASSTGAFWRRSSLAASSSSVTSCCIPTAPSAAACSATGTRTWRATASPRPRPTRSSRAGRRRTLSSRCPTSWPCSPPRGFSPRLLLARRRGRRVRRVQRSESAVTRSTSTITSAGMPIRRAAAMIASGDGASYRQ